MANKIRSIHKSIRYFLPITFIGMIIIIAGIYAYKLVPISIPISINEISNATGETTLTFNPNSITTTVNTETSLALVADTGNARLTILSVEISYDPSKISTPIVTLGDFLPNPFSSPVVANGKISFTVAASPDSGGVTGSGTIATLTFKPTAVGSSTLSFTDKTLSASLTTDKIAINSDTLKSASNITITSNATTGNSGNSGATDTSISTPTPTPIATPAQNSVSSITTTPKPTVRPTSTPAQQAKFTTEPEDTNPYQYAANTDTDNQVGIISIPNNDQDFDSLDTSVEEPSIWEKTILGWGIIFKYIFSIFDIN